MRKLASFAWFMFVGVLAMVPQAHATPLIDFTADNSSFVWFGNDAGCSGGCTLGYTFDVTTSVSIDALGVYDAGSNGLNNTHPVALWNGAGTLLASTSVGPSATLFDNSASGTGRYAYSAISTQTLGPGTYVVGALFAASDIDPVVFEAAGTFSNDPGAAYGELRFLNLGALTFPTGTGPGSDRYFGAAARITGAAAVPEPGTLGLLGLALAGIALGRRRGAG